MSQSIEQLEQIINDVAMKIGRQMYELRDGMFRIYLDPDATVEVRAIRGPTVQLFIKATPLDKHFRDIIHSALKSVNRLHTPVSIEKWSYFKTDRFAKWKKDPQEWKPNYQLDENRVKYETTTKTIVRAIDKGTGLTITLESLRLSEWALKSRALIELSRKVEKFLNEHGDEEVDNATT